MVNVHDPQDVLALIEAKQDAVVSVAGAAVPGEVTSEGFAQSLGIAGEAIRDEDHDSYGDALRQARHVAPSWPGPDDPVLTHVDGRPSSRRS